MHHELHSESLYIARASACYMGSYRPDLALTSQCFSFLIHTTSVRPHQGIGWLGQSEIDPFNT